MRRPRLISSLLKICAACVTGFALVSFMEMPLLKFIPKFRSKNMPRKAKLLTLAFCTSLVGGSAVAGNSANEQRKVVVKLDRIQNTSTGDPGPIFQELQRPQIYLWVVLFRIGGQDYYVDNHFN